MRETIEIFFNQNDSDLKDYAFQFRFYIKHKTMAFSKIQEEIPLQTFNGWTVGADRKTPNGKCIGGVRHDTYWNYQLEVKGRRDFFNFTIDFMGNIVSKYSLEDFFKEITSSGGSINIVIGLIDDRNIGDVLSLEHMQFLIKHGVNLGLECFP